MKTYEQIISELNDFIEAYLLDNAPLNHNSLKDLIHNIEASSYKLPEFVKVINLKINELLVDNDFDQVTFSRLEDEIKSIVGHAAKKLLI